MRYEETGRLLKGLGGLYEVLLDKGGTPASGGRIEARAKGNFRHEGTQPLIGDRVCVQYDDTAVSHTVPGDMATVPESAGTAPESTGTAPESTGATPGNADAVSESAGTVPGNTAKNKDGGGAVIAKILPRRNALIRPPMANLDFLFLTLAAANPAPMTETVDKLISIAEFNKIEPVLVIGKADLAPDVAESLAKLYTCAGFSVFRLSATEGAGVPELRAFIARELPGKTAAFAGASGVGKSTLLHALFPRIQPETGEVSRKIARGRHTTRRVELYPVENGGFLADTPGFSMLDFVRFDFFTAKDLPGTMREFAPYLGQCRYTKCTHTKEEGCAVLAAVREGKIAKSRHDSFLSMYAALKDKHDWGKNNAGISLHRR